MAHPNLAGTTSRKLLTAGFAAALIALPLGGSAIAADLGLTGDDPELVQKLSLLSAEELELYEAGLIDADGNPIDEVLETTAKTTRTVTSVVEKAVAEVAPGDSPAPSNTVPGNDSDQQSAGGPTYTGVSEPSGSNGSERAARPAPAFDANGPVQPGMRSYSPNPSMQSFVAPPVVSAPFAFDLPQVAERFVGDPLVAPSAATPAFASASTPMGDMVPGGIPGWMLATASGMLLFVGGAHALHAYDRRWKAANVTTTSS